MVVLEDLLADLTAESAQLDALVDPLPETAWARPTPAPGWTVAHQIAHLAWTDHATVLAATDVEAFYRAVASAPDVTRLVDHGAEEFLAPPAALLARWRAGREALTTALAAVPPGGKLPWVGTAMSPASMATARIMETWAHGQDVADAVGVTRAPTDRLRHIVHLGFRTLGHSFAAHGRAVPTAPVRIDLTAPDGATWSHGPAGATDRVTGPALDFCLLVTQRRHRADLALTATGPVADEWLDVAQAFAGPPGPGREPASPDAGREPASPDAGHEPLTGGTGGRPGTATEVGT